MNASSGERQPPERQLLGTVKTMERRHFLQTMGLAGANAAITSVWAQPPKLYDILIKGGEVIDPNRACRGSADVAFERF